MHDSQPRVSRREVALTLSGVGMTGGTTLILDDIRLEISRGRRTVLIGPNGAGKSTLLKVMMGLMAPSRGTVELARAASGMPLQRAFVFQTPVMLRRSAAENVRFALTSAGLPAGMADALALLEQVGLAGLADRPARRLSGGEKQRLAIARALARRPALLLLDEPTASLDPAQTLAVEAIIAAAAARGVTIVMATHDLGQARRLADDIVFLSRGRIVEHGRADRFFDGPQTSEARRFLAGELVL